MVKLKIKKGDKVIVISGPDRGKVGEVLKSIPTDSKVVVSGVNLKIVHKKQTQTDQGGRISIEKPIHISNVSHLDPKDNKPTKVSIKVLEDGKKVRVAKRSGEVIDKQGK